MFVSQTKLRLSEPKEMDALKKKANMRWTICIEMYICPAGLNDMSPFSQCTGVIQEGQSGVSMYFLGFVSCRDWRGPLLEQRPLSLGQCCLNTDKCWLPTPALNLPLYPNTFCRSYFMIQFRFSNLGYGSMLIGLTFRILKVSLFHDMTEIGIICILTYKTYVYINNSVSCS